MLILCGATSLSVVDGHAQWVWMCPRCRMRIRFDGGLVSDDYVVIDASSRAQAVALHFRYGCVQE